MVYTLSFPAGLVTALDNPTRQSFYMEMVEASDLTNAVSLNSAVFMGARIVGASLAGALIAAFGTAICFLIDGLSYLAVIGGAARDATGRPPRTRERRASGTGSCARGSATSGTRAELRRPLVLMAIVFTFAFNWSVLLPLLAKHTFGGNAAHVRRDVGLRRSRLVRRRAAAWRTATARGRRRRASPVSRP